MAGTTQSRGWIPFVLLAVSLAVTLSVAFLQFPGAERSDKFVISLSAFCLAEIAFFLIPLLLRAYGSGKDLPWSFLQTGILTFYWIAVIVLSLTSVSFVFVQLLSAHLVLLALVLIVLGASAMAAGHTRDSHAGAVDRAQFFCRHGKSLGGSRTGYRCSPALNWIR
jgi:hypothetical protein